MREKKCRKPDMRISVGLWIFMLVLSAEVLWMNGSRGEIVYAYTQPVVTNSGIVYPISLSSGKDAKGRVVFPDDKFLAYVRTEKFQSGSYVGYEFDLDENGLLSKEECELVRVLSISSRKDIGSVKGIEAFPKLRELYCSGTGIKELDLSNNPRLQILTCGDNALTSLDTSACPLLKELKVSGCRLTSLNLGKNPALNFLTCMYQERDGYQYKEGERYKVSLEDFDTELNLAKVSNVKIDGAEGDGVNSGYDAKSGTVYCSDEMQKVSYYYDFSFAGTAGSSVDTTMEVTINVKTGVRECYVTNGGSKVLAQYIENGQKDREPEAPKKNGYRLTGWYKSSSCAPEDRWTFGLAITENTVLHAGWEKKSYKVAYDTQGGLPALAIKQGNIDWWSVNLIPAGESVLRKDGYNLAGWLTESGRLITGKNAGTVSYGQAVANDEGDSTLLTAKWEAKSGYKLRFVPVLPSKDIKEMTDFPANQLSGKIQWNSCNYITEDEEPDVAGYDFLGWYTAKTGGTKVTYTTPYSVIYSSQFKGDSEERIPTLYARFKKKTFTIYYKECGGSKVADRTGIVWGSARLLPKKKTKRKNYIFAGWKCGGKKVTKKTRINDICDGYDDSVTLKAVWYKKYEKKGKKFWRYGCQYKVVQSNKKGNKVSLIKVKKGKKKVAIRNKVFYNEKYFTLKSIKKGALKRVKKVSLRVPKKKQKKYRKMIRKAGKRLSK